MHKVFSLCLAMVAAIFLTGCPVPVTPPPLHVSWTVNGTAASFTKGHVYTDSQPHGVSNPAAPATAAFASSDVWAAVPTPQYIIIYFDGIALGTGLSGTLEYTDTVMVANSFTAPLLVNCTAYGADEGGIIAGTFTGAGPGSGGQVITNGSFQVKRNDFWGLPTPP